MTICRECGKLPAMICVACYDEKMMKREKRKKPYRDDIEIPPVNRELISVRVSYGDSTGHKVVED